ncbi:TPA: integrase arm-type DNA-binding domain-containing protein [Pseudomonas aeruginosa]
MPKLTKNYIDKITAPADKEAFHWDDSLKGFGLRVTPTGKITYIVQGRVNGSSPRISIGPHGVFTVDQARDVAREHLRSMRMGIDPRAIAKKDAAQRVTLRDVADAYKRDRPLKDSSKAEIERHVTTTFEAWLKKPLRDINREMVTKRFNDIKNNGTRGDGPAPAQANQSMAVLRALFNYAIREYREPDGSPVLTDNPVDVLYKKWVPLKPRTSRVPDTKVGAVWSFLTHARDQAYNRDTLASIDLVMLLMLTGLRIGECSELT